MTKIKFLLINLVTLLVLTLVSCSQLDNNPAVLDQTSTGLFAPSSTWKSTRVLSLSETPSPEPTLTQTRKNSPTVTYSPISTNEPTTTPTPSITSTPTISPTPTYDFPDVTVNVANAHCRYGPGKAYLHAADLNQADHGIVWNRNHAGTWLWVRFDKINYACWVATSLLDIEGDILTVSAYSPPLPKSSLYGPPTKVIATRNGDQVVVSWDEVWMTKDDDRGYLLQVNVCQNGFQIDLAVHTNSLSFTFLDEKDCSGISKGRLYAVEKHGYTDPVQIPWP